MVDMHPLKWTISHQRVGLAFSSVVTLPIVLLSTSGTLGSTSNTSDVIASGVQQFEKPLGRDENPPGSVAMLLGQLGKEEYSDTVAAQNQGLVAVGAGLTALPKKLVDKIYVNEFIDVKYLPPAKGSSRVLSQMLEVQIVLVQAADLVQSRKMISDLATWLQCYSLYVAVVTIKQPDRIPELMTLITRASTRYKWPAWLVYKQNFRQEAANNPSQSWAKVNAIIYIVFLRTKTSHLRTGVSNVV